MKDDNINEEKPEHEESGVSFLAIGLKSLIIYTLSSLLSGIYIWIYFRDTQFPLEYILVIWPLLTLFIYLLVVNMPKPYKEFINRIFPP